MANPVVHFEIHGNDVPGLEKFFADLFGWTFESMGEGYSLVDTHGGTGIKGGLSKSQDGKPFQTLYIEVESIDAHLTTIEGAGGKTFMGKQDVPNGPTIALFNDTAGNVLGLVEGMRDADPTASKGAGSPVGWFEIHGGDFDTQAAFFATVFGWKASKSEGPGFTYGELTIDAPYGTAGAISVSSQPFTGITIWTQVTDVAAALAKAVELGATKDMDPMSPQEGLTIATYLDPQGNRLGLFKPGN